MEVSLQSPSRPTRTRRTATSWILTCTFLSLPLAAQAQEAAPTPTAAPPAETMAQATTSEQDMGDLEARGHFRLGRQYYESGSFADAAQEFEIAYGLSGRGGLLYNVYLAYRDAQDLPNAARALRGYLASVPDAPDHDHLQARLTQLEQTVTREEEAEAERIATAAEAARQLEAAEQRAMEAEMAAAQVPSRPAWPWGLVGGGLAVTAAGVVVGVLATLDADQLRRDCVLASPIAGFEQPLVAGTTCAESVNLASRRSAIQAQALAGDIVWITGSLIAVTGLVLAFALPDEHSAAPAVSASCTSTGCFGSVTGSF